MVVRDRSPLLIIETVNHATQELSRIRVGAGRASAGQIGREGQS